MTTECIPTEWEHAKLAPIHKSEERRNPDNCRPISVLPTVSKIQEKAIYTQLIDFLEKNNLLSNSQYGYHAKRSSKLAATLFLDDVWKEMDKGIMVDVAFIDLTKAFDTIKIAMLWH